MFDIEEIYMSVDLVVFKIYLTGGNEIIAQEPTNAWEFKTRTYVPF